MSSTQLPQDPTALPEQPVDSTPSVDPTQPTDSTPSVDPTQPTDSTPSVDPTQPTDPAQPADSAPDGTDAGTDETGGDLPTTDPNEGEPTEQQPQVVSGPLTVSLEMMLFEAGMIANSLSSKSAGNDLAEKLFAAEQEAEGRGQASLTFAFTPFEAGMALNAMSRSQDGTMDKLQELLHQGLVDLMNSLGVQPLSNDQGGGTL